MSLHNIPPYTLPLAQVRRPGNLRAKLNGQLQSKSKWAKGEMMQRQGNNEPRKLSFHATAQSQKKKEKKGPLHKKMAT